MDQYKYIKTSTNGGIAPNYLILIIDYSILQGDSNLHADKQYLNLS